MIDEAGARRDSRTTAKHQTIDKEFVEEIVAQIARIPARSVTMSQKERLRNLDRDLKLTIYGQEHCDRRARDVDPAGAFGSSFRRESLSDVSCFAVPPAWARPNSANSSVIAWEFRFFAST